jgi:hypothetical protein
MHIQKVAKLQIYRCNTLLGQSRCWRPLLSEIEYSVSLYIFIVSLEDGVW